MAKRRKAKAKTAKKTTKKRKTRRTTPRRTIRREFSWSPTKFALHYRRWNTNKAETSILLSHPTAPFPSVGLVADAIDDSTMQELGLRYIVAVSENPNIDPPLDLPQGWIDALGETRADSTFRWLPLGWPPKDRNSGNAGDPFVSFQAQRFAADGRTLLPDQTVILFASEWIDFNGKPVVAGSEFGIRLVAHALQQNGGFRIWITGMTASLPSGHYRTQGLSTAPTATLGSVQLINSTFTDIKAEIAKQVNLKSDDISLRGVRVAIVNGAVQFEWRGSTRPLRGVNYTRATPYSFVFLRTEETGSLVSKAELVADAAGDAWVFPLDPASQKKTTPIHDRRPTRDEPWLDESPPYSLSFLRYQETIAAGQLFPHLVRPNFPLPPEMEVVVCPGFVVADNPPGVAPGSVKRVRLPGTGLDPPLALSNDFAAISAFNNVREFFRRLAAYGFNAFHYFRVARMPLKLYYRSGIRPGPGKDGQTVNARVLVEGWRPDWVGPTPPGERPVLQMHLALADLSTRRRTPWNGADRSQAEPLGIAADARWIWHEIGHVLLMASVGELEFRFAHSAGDALAAIVADPQSALSADPKWRGATFPWVFTPRRHDRCVLCGWGWSGTLHYDMSQVPDATHPRRKGYWTEQILSSTLFRLYQCLGGDTTPPSPPGGPGEWARESASHYCVYLIMRGIQILGTSGIQLANEPEQFLWALVWADTLIGAWNVSWNLQWDVLSDPPPAAPIPFQFNRVGGCAWKVIHWAFEAQGMFNDSGTITNSPGLPPPVDVYIKDRRPTTEVTPYGPIAYGPGSYVPVSLDWTTALWQADPTNGVHIVGGNITVKVGNRGSQPATNVQVSVWWCPWPTGGNPPPPRWGDPMTPWTPCNPQPSASQNIAPGSQVTFGPFAFAPPAATRYLVFAQATCPDDKANTDPTAGMACSQIPTPLLDLVAGDNNLGLIVRP